MEKYYINVNDQPPIELQPDEDAQPLAKLSPTEYHLLSGEKSYHSVIEQIDLATKTVQLMLNGKTYICRIQNSLDQLLDTMDLKSKEQLKSKDLVSTMPGLVLSIQVTEGQSITKGEPLMILEAMKMENVLKAGADGIIKKIACQVGEAVDKGQLLIEIGE